MSWTGWTWWINPNFLRLSSLSFMACSISHFLRSSTLSLLISSLIWKANLALIKFRKAFKLNPRSLWYASLSSSLWRIKRSTKLNETQINITVALIQVALLGIFSNLLRSSSVLFRRDAADFLTSLWMKKSKQIAVNIKARLGKNSKKVLILLSCCEDHWSKSPRQRP